MESVRPVETRSLLQRLFFYPGPLWRLASLWGQFWVVISVIVWGPYMALRVLLGADRSWQSWAIRSWVRFVSDLFFIRYETVGVENHKANEPSLVVSNHQSLLDIPAAYLSLDGHIRMVGKKELFSIPIFGWVLSRIEIIPIERGNRVSGRDVSNLIREKIKSGLHVWLAPEGTRSVGYDIGTFKKGSFAIAIEASVPVQPIVVENSCEACPKGSLAVRPGVAIRVFVLPRISTRDYSIDSRAELAQFVRSKMVEQQQIARARWNQEPSLR